MQYICPPSVLNVFNKVGRCYHSVRTACVKPHQVLVEQYDVQFAILQIRLVNICDFKFSSRGRFEIFCNVYGSVVVEIQSRHCIIGFWIPWFFFKGYHFVILVELHDAKYCRVFFPITEYRCALCLCCFAQCFVEILSVEEAVSPENKAYGIQPDWLSH